MIAASPVHEPACRYSGEPRSVASGAFDCCCSPASTERWANKEDGCLIDVGADGCGVAYYPKGRKSRYFVSQGALELVRTGKHWRRVQ